MLAAAYGTVEDIEILWVLVAFLGGIYSVMNYGDSRRDWRFVQENKITNGRRIVTWVSMWSELIRAIIQGIFLGIGVLALMLPSPPTPKLPWEQVAAGFLVRWGLITSSILLTLKSYLARRARKEVEKEH